MDAVCAPVGVVGEFTPLWHVLIGDVWVPVFMPTFRKVTASPVSQCILDSTLKEEGGF